MAARQPILAWRRRRRASSSTRPEKRAGLRRVQGAKTHLERATVRRSLSDTTASRRPFDEVDAQAIAAIRGLGIDAVEKANSGHPGLPMGAAPMAWVLWSRHLNACPGDPDWPDRDRFVLSAGHGSMLLYALLHLAGYPVSLDDIRDFRQWESRTPGHPETFATPGVEATTGPLGQGAGNSVGMAIAERALRARFPGLVNHRVFALVSDGDLMEGVACEAASLAGQLGLGRLVWLYDRNDVTLDGPASLSFSVEDVAARHRALGWHVQTVADGNHDLDGSTPRSRLPSPRRGSLRSSW